MISVQEFQTLAASPTYTVPVRETETPEASAPARYFECAIRGATFEHLEDGSTYGEIPGFDGVYGQGDSIVAALHDLKSALEDWVFLKLMSGDADIPVVDGIALNHK
jgi:predicted RNase H-like HicB family nuclease